MFVGLKGLSLQTGLSRPPYKPDFDNGCLCRQHWWRNAERSYCKVLLLVELIKFDISFNLTIKQKASFIIYKNSTNNGDSDGDSNDDSNDDNDKDSNSDNNGDNDVDNNGDNAKKIYTQDKLGRLVNLDHVMAPNLRPGIYSKLLTQDEIGTLVNMAATGLRLDTISFTWRLVGTN